MKEAYKEVFFEDKEEGEEKKSQLDPEQEPKMVTYNEMEDTCDGEPYLFSFKRWKKIAIDFRKESKDGSISFDISKLPEIFDNVKFDALHNPELTNDVRINLLHSSQIMNRFIVPMEYGLTKDQKITVGMQILTPLLKKIKNDLLWWTREQNNPV